MSELQWLAVATTLLAVVCFVISRHDRQLVLRWWRRRRLRRETPWSNITLTFLPACLLLIAAALAIEGMHSKNEKKAEFLLTSPP